MRNEGNIIVSNDELQEGIPKAPKEIAMDLTIAEFEGKQIDPISKQSSDSFVADDEFLKTRAFIQFLWRLKRGHFKEICEKKKEEFPNRDITEIENETKGGMMKQFERITPDEGRAMVHTAGVLILPEWDIADAIIFYQVRKSKVKTLATTE